MAYKLTISFLAALLLQSCLYTKNAAIRKFCNQDSATYKFTDTVTGTVTAPPVTLSTSFNCDSLMQALAQAKQQAGHLADSLGYITLYADSLGTIKAKLLPNGKIKLKAKTTPKEIPFSAPIERIIKVPCNCPPPPQPDLWLRIKNMAANFSLYIVLGAVLVMAVNKLIKKYT